MQINYEVKDTADMGLGLYACQDIAKGTTIYVHK